ncbi:MAG: hypothetical protein HPY72_05705 [Anaerolineae bacterium]|nr:hypothetical protein [Anaerolineae bacterium]
MLIAIIFLFLVISCAAAFLMKKHGARRPMVWLATAAASLVVWLLVMFIPRNQTIALNWQNWFFASGTHIGLYFQIDARNWGMIAAIMTVHVAFLFTSASKEDFGKDYIFWIAETAAIALTFAVLSTADLWSLIISWTAMDVGIWFYQLFLRKKFDSSRFLRAFMFRFSGSLLLIFVTARIAGGGHSLLLKDIPASASALIFLAALLHSGIFPLPAPEDEGENHAAVLDFLTFLLPSISSLFLVTFLPNHQISFLLGIILGVGALIGLALLVFISSRAVSETKAVYNLAVSFVLFNAYRFITKTTSGLQGWFILILVFCTWLLLHERRGKNIILFPVLVMIFFSGLPFSLMSYGNSGILMSGFGIPALVSFGMHLYLLLIFARFIFREKADFNDLGTSSQFTYSIALFITISGLALIAFHTLAASEIELTDAWAGMLIVILTLGIQLWLRNRPSALPAENRLERIDTNKITRLLSFDWLFIWTNAIMNWTRPLVAGFSLLLEGEGGVLWSIVFLALLVTLIQTG